MEFPIRAKILVLMSAALLLAVATYLSLALRIFKDDKTELVYELNAGNVKTVAAEVDSYLGKIADKVKLLTLGHRDAEWTRAVYEAEPDLIAFTLYAPTPELEQWKAVASAKNTAYLKMYGLPENEIERIHREVPLPFAKVISRKTWVQNSTLPGGAPILTLAMAIGVQDGGVTTEHLAVADLKLDRLLKIVSDSGIAQITLVDSEARALAHKDSAFVSERRSMADVPIVQAAFDSPVAFELKPFEYQGHKWLGAYASSSFGGVKVISQVEQAEAFRAARRLIEKSLLFGLLVLTLVILVSWKLSEGLTQPIQLLVAATDRLARWDFSSPVHVKSRDELSKLARAFNSMASNLQTQRQQLEQNQAELEIKVRERTAALEEQQKRLSETQEALLRTTRLASLGELAGAAAHEVLNPVNNMNIRVERIGKSISTQEKDDLALLTEIVQAWEKTFRESGSDGLQKEFSKPSQQAGKTLLQEDLENLAAISRDLQKRLDTRKEDLEFLTQEITRITKIVNNMRTLSRVGGERKPLDVHEPIDETVTAVADFLKKSGVTLVKDFSGDPRSLFRVTGDKDELVQVFTNLIRNSVHAIVEADRRAGTLRVSTQRTPERIEIRIADNGTGISKENIGKVFEPNFTTKSVEQGTGLGLSISRRLVRAFGGDIVIEKSILGEGTVFLIWFPTPTKAEA